MRTVPPATMTDLYEITMAAGYWAEGRTERATFELFTRRMSGERSYLLAGGLEAVLDYLECLRFTSEEVAYLRGLPSFASFPAGFFDMLESFRFTGDVRAVPEGTPIFPNEPFLSVEAPIVEAQLVETALLALVNFPTSVATKASRLVEAAGKGQIVEFGARRAHGTEAALVASRAAFIGGCTATSNVEAGMRFGIPVVGTIAHSWIMSFDDEVNAFRAYQRAFPSNAVLLIDTYDTVRATKRVTEAFEPGEIAGVRIDSGDIDALSRAVRRILDEAGFETTKILASGDLNEWSIDKLAKAGAPIDSFGVGTDLTTVRDAPALGVVYKLVEIVHDGRREMKMKCSEGKTTYPGKKQVWRSLDGEGRMVGDVVALADEPGPAGATPLLEPVMRSGRREGRVPSLPELRQFARENVARVPDALRGLAASERPYPVRFSDRIRSIQEELRARTQ
jgi:nicotinate phosphoribosyltransferase